MFFVKTTDKIANNQALNVAIFFFRGKNTTQEEGGGGYKHLAKPLRFSLFIRFVLESLERDFYQTLIFIFTEFLTRISFFVFLE